LFSKEISGASPSGIIPLEETAVCLGEQQMCMKQLICDECYVFCSPLPHQVQLTLHISVQPPPHQVCQLIYIDGARRSAFGMTTPSPTTPPSRGWFHGSPCSRSGQMRSSWGN
jgi:hypothetical protein